MVNNKKKQKLLSFVFVMIFSFCSMQFLPVTAGTRVNASAANQYPRYTAYSLYGSDVTYDYASAADLSTVLSHLDRLMQAADEYYGDKKKQSEKNMAVLTVIRALRDSYNDKTWQVIATVDEGFENRIFRRCPESLYFFYDDNSGENLVDPVSGEKIDFKHLLAVFQVGYFISVEDELFQSLREAVGWAGDLLQCVVDLQDMGTGTYKDDVLSAKGIVGREGSSMPMADMLADIDASNLSCCVKTGDAGKEKTLTRLIQEYYDREASGRFSSFIANQGGMDCFQQRVNSHTILEEMDDYPDKMLLESLEDRFYHRPKQEELSALNTAFVDFMVENSENEYDVWNEERNR